MRIIGDVHGKFDEYSTIVRNSSGKTLQLGDMGFNYGPLEFIDSDKNKFFGGNHENYETIDSVPHCLGDYGIWEGLHFVRGALSVDRPFRTEGFDWFPSEELRVADYIEIRKLWQQNLPEIVVTHDGPSQGIEMFDYGEKFRSFTVDMLTQLFMEFRPKLWIFGHHHKSRKSTVDGCTFVCLAELEHLDL